MGGSAIESFRLFKEICGDEAMTNVIVATTMWQHVDNVNAVEKEAELSDKYFNEAISRGARMLRHDNTESSAKAILRDLLRHDEEPKVLLMQKEMTNERKQIPDTQAGKHLLDALDNLFRSLQKKLSSQDGED